MSPEEKEQTEIEAGRDIKVILAEPAFLAAVKAVERDYVAEFTDADSDDKRRQIWAKTRALQDLLIELAAVVGRGKIASAARTNREAVEERNRRANSRKSS